MGTASDHHRRSVTRIIVVGEPVEVRLGTDDEGANLVIAADLAAAKERCLIAIGEVHAEYTVDHVTPAPAAANVAANIEPRPTKLWRRIDRRRPIDRRCRR